MAGIDGLGCIIGYPARNGFYRAQYFCTTTRPWIFKEPDIRDAAVFAYFEYHNNEPPDFMFQCGRCIMNFFLQAGQE